jgi:hypothetical protein
MDFPREPLVKMVSPAWAETMPAARSKERRELFMGVLGSG